MNIHKINLYSHNGDFLEVLFLKDYSFLDPEEPDDFDWINYDEEINSRQLFLKDC
jgi:hypothetical protein